MSTSVVIALLVVPVLLAVLAGCVCLKRAFDRPKLLPEELALAVAWVFIVGACVWFSVFLRGSTLLGFGAPWTWLTTLHFIFAGFGTITVNALCCRVVSDPRALRILRVLLVCHPIVYLITAGGILGYRFCDEIGGTCYGIMFLAQLAAVVFGRPNRIAKGPLILLTIALSIPLITMIPALTWAWGRPIFDIPDMVRYHGIVNAIGFIGLGLCALAWGRVSSHSQISSKP